MDLDPSNLLLAAVAVTLPAAARAAAIIATVLIATFARRAHTRRAAMQTLKTLLPSAVDWGILRRPQAGTRARGTADRGAGKDASGSARR